MEIEEPTIEETDPLDREIIDDLFNSLFANAINSSSSKKKEPVAVEPVSIESASSSSSEEKEEIVPEEIISEEKEEVIPEKKTFEDKFKQEIYSSDEDYMKTPPHRILDEIGGFQPKKRKIDTFDESNSEKSLTTDLSEQDEEGEEYKWIGEPIKKELRRTYYYGFSRNGEEFLLQQGCLFYAEESYWIGKIEELFEDNFGKKKLLVRWFVKPEDTSVKVELLHPQEVFYDANSNVNNLSTIAKKCTVQELSNLNLFFLHIKGQPPTPEMLREFEEKKDFYFCYRLHSKSKVVPIQQRTKFSGRFVFGFYNNKERATKPRDFSDSKILNIENEKKYWKDAKLIAEAEEKKKSNSSSEKERRKSPLIVEKEQRKSSFIIEKEKESKKSKPSKDLKRKRGKPRPRIRKMKPQNRTPHIEQDNSPTLNTSLEIQNDEETNDEMPQTPPSKRKISRKPEETFKKSSISLKADANWSFISPFFVLTPSTGWVFGKVHHKHTNPLIPLNVLRDPKRKRINITKTVEFYKKKKSDENSSLEIPIYLKRNIKKVEKFRKKAKERKSEPSRMNIKAALKRKAIEPKKTKSNEPAFQDVWGFFTNKRPTNSNPVENIPEKKVEKNSSKQSQLQANAENLDDLVPLMDNFFSQGSLLDSESMLRNFQNFSTSSLK